MRITTTLITACFLSGMQVMAGDFDLLLDTLKKGMPGKTNGAVACNLDAHKDLLRELAASAHHRGLSLRFFNVTNPDQANSASSTMRSSNPDFVILLDKDPLLGASGTSTKSFTAVLTSNGIPVVSTEEAAIKLGAILAAGPKTQGKVIPNGSKPKSFGIKL